MEVRVISLSDSPFSGPGFESHSVYYIILPLTSWNSEQYYAQFELFGLVVYLATLTSLCAINTQEGK